MGDVCSNRSCCDSRWRVASLRPSKLAVQLGLMFQTKPTFIDRTLFCIKCIDFILRWRIS
jgi:hypothetical protein